MLEGRPFTAMCVIAPLSTNTIRLVIERNYVHKTIGVTQRRFIDLDSQLCGEVWDILSEGCVVLLR
jgi:hypothetical protein